MGKREERLSRLVDILKVRSYVSVRELASILGVSEMTVRRDLARLRPSKIAENVAGTVVYNSVHEAPKTESEYSLNAAMTQQDAQKRAIGRCAAALVEPEDLIILDTGTTTEQIVPHLPQDRSITAICYNINILVELRRRVGVEIIMAGGYYHPNTQMFESPEGIQFIRRMRAQKLFVSAAGVHRDLGVTCANGYEVPMKQAVLRSSLKKILVADSSKFGLLKPAYFCELSEVDEVVTDGGLPPEWRDLLAEREIRLHIAPPLDKA